MLQRVATLDTVYADKAESIGWIVLNRPEKLNAMTKAMQGDIIACLDHFRGDNEIRAVIIRGEGERAFCAGADIGDWTGANAVDRWRYDKLHARRVFEEMVSFPRPIIAAIRGYALGGGAELALAADIRVASNDCRFGLTEIKFGMIPGAGGTQRLARLIGEGMAMRLVLSGEILEGQSVADMGLVEYMVEPDEVFSKSRQLALEIAAKAPIAIEAGKELVKAAARNTMEGGLMHEIALSTLCFATRDKEEAIAAFREKRQPSFQAR